jgi:[lysine-biosynthesis-protein LysW]---L-2-aminoadipate ligase
MKLSIIYDKLRFEEKELNKKATDKGLITHLLDAKPISFSTDLYENNHLSSDVFLQRCISHFRGLYITSCLEYLNHKVINKYDVNEICGNKLRTSLVLAKCKIPSPKTYFAFSPDSFKDLVNRLGFPLVLKPLVGSWGRGVFPIRNEEMLNIILETREEHDSALSRIYYVQELIKRPPRDIRCIVAGDQIITAVYRYSIEGEWRTNVARGGHTGIAPITHDLEEIVIKAATSVGGGILGVDVMEDEKQGLVVHEINSNVEFRGASQVSQVDIANSMIEYIISVFKK